MKLYNVKNINGFFEAVKGCKGKVNVVVNEETVNLKDNIKTYKNIFTATTSDSGIPELNIKTEHSEDAAKLLRFAIRG